MPDKVLFLTLKTFGFTGGIEKVCRVVTRALYDLSVKDLINPKSYSMYDRNIDRDAKYILKQQFKGFAGSQVRFSVSAIAEGVRSQKVILSHINLLFIALVIKRISPKTQIILFVHGIEVWRELSKWKVAFLRNKCDELWAVSKYTQSKMVEEHGISIDKIKVVNNCLDPFLEIPSNFEKPVDLLNRYKIKEKDPVLFTLTRLSSSELYKGYDLVIETLPELTKSYPTIRYLIAGKADDIERTRIMDLVYKLNLEKHVSLLGFVPDVELTEHFLLADVFVMPSRKEGFGIVFIEAAACGCENIAGNQDGSVDALLNGKLGSLVSPLSRDEITAAINQTLQKPRTSTSAQAIQQLCTDKFGYISYYEKIKHLLLEKQTKK